MNTFPLSKENKPSSSTIHSSRRYLQRELKRKSRQGIKRINNWLDSEVKNRKYNLFFIKLYFEWKYVMQKKKFSFKEMETREDEAEFIEILKVIQEALGLHYSEFPFKFQETTKQFKEKLIDNKSQYNSREDCYIWSDEQSRCDDRFTKP